jgi:hypothetical protein
VVKLMDALYKNTSLAQLDLRNNQALSEDAINAVLDALDFSHRWYLCAHFIVVISVLI